MANIIVSSRPGLAVIHFALLLSLSACAPGESKEAKNSYRVPYANGTVITPIQDYLTHSTPNARMFDLQAQEENTRLVAAAPGWVRYIEDSNAGGGDNNYVWIEHPHPYCPKLPNEAARNNWPGKPDNYDQTCEPCEKEYCNEWTVHAHMQTGTVTNPAPNGAGLSPGDWVEAGDFIGLEGDVGGGNGPRIPRHLHWHVVTIAPGINPSVGGGYESFVTNILGCQPAVATCRPELIPQVCYQGGTGVLRKGESYTAAACR
jgi:murein DD-endopeptidase MepM/ murein hydrolase activator NlpD